MQFIPWDHSDGAVLVLFPLLGSAVIRRTREVAMALYHCLKVGTVFPAWLRSCLCMGLYRAVLWLLQLPPVK